jgi:SAM-dependent methyltransferase
MAKELKTYDEYAETWAQRMRSGENITHEYLEKPAMFAAVPDLKGKDVLCIGCGTGEECRSLKDRGARRVLGMDVSKGLIEYAKKSYPDLEFEVMAMEQLDVPEGSFDFAYSSLAMHYAEDWTDILRRIRRALKPGSFFLFSTHHPVRWGAVKKKEGDVFSYLLGFSKKGKDVQEIFGDYLTTRKIEETWFNELSVTYYHKPFGSILKNILDSGFIIKDFIEPKPVEEAKAKKPNFWAIHQKIPLFMIFKLQK